MLQKLYSVLKISILVLVRYSVSLLQKPHKSDGLFITVGSRLTDYNYNPSILCCNLEKVTFTFLWRVSIFWGSPRSSSHSASCLNWVDSLTRWSRVTPRFQATVNDSINLRLIGGFSWLHPRLLYSRESQSNSYLVIGQARSASWCFGTSSWWPVWHDDKAHCRPSNRTDTRIAAMQIASCVHVFQQYTLAFGHVDISIGLQKMLNCQT